MDNIENNSVTPASTAKMDKKEDGTTFAMPPCSPKAHERSPNYRIVSNRQAC